MCAMNSESSSSDVMDLPLLKHHRRVWLQLTVLASYLMHVLIRREKLGFTFNKSVVNIKTEIKLSVVDLDNQALPQ